MQISEQKIENAIEESTKAIEEQGGAMSSTVPDAKKYREQLAEIGESAIVAGEKIQAVGDKISGFGRGWSTKVTAPIVATSGAVFKLASDWESDWIGVEKVIEGTDDQLANLKQGLRDMTKEMPQTHREIAEVAAAAGQLGIQTEHIEEFSKVMLDLGVATNMTSDEAATALARLANITQMSADDYDRLGATIVGLGNNLATTEKEIVEMGLRLAGAGKQIGLSEAQTLAFSGALSSVGIAAEAGGSAFSKVMVNMQLATERGGKELKNFAKVAGMSSSDFKKAFEKDAAGAIIKFIEGLATAEDRGMSAIGVLDEIGITEVRMRDSLLRAAGASDVFSDALELGTKSWEENLALTEEAEKRYGSTESQLKIMWNRIKDTGITLGEVLVPAIMSALDAAEPFIEKIEQGAKAFSEMDEEQQQTILKLIALAAAIGPASIMLGGLTTTIGGVVKTGGKLLTTFGKVGGTKGLLGRFGAMGLTGGPVGLAIAGVAGLGFAYLALRDDTLESMKAVNESIDQRQEEIDSLDRAIARFGELQEKNKLTTDEVLRYMDIMDELKEAKTEEAIKKLTDEQADLLEKSGLTNDEMVEFLGLNDEIVEKSPTTAQAISEQGNAYAAVLDEVKKLNDAERQRLLQDTYTELNTALGEQSANLEKQAKLQDEIKAKEAERTTTLDNILNYGNEIMGIDQEIEAIKRRMEGKSIEEQAKLEEKLRILVDQKGQLELQRTAEEEIIKKLEKQIGKKQKSLDKTNEELKQFDELKYKYEALILQEAGLVAEKGKGVEKLQQEQKEIDKAREKLIKKKNAGKLSTEEYQKQNDKLNKQQQGIDTARTKMLEFNKIAGREIFKDVNVSTKPSADDLNRRLTSPLSRTLTLRVNQPQIAPLYAKGTKFHPGGPAIVGEEGPELIKQGRKWSLADLGMYNLQRGAKVFTAKQTQKILSGIKKMPKYADGVGVTSDMQSRLNRTIGNDLTDRAQKIKAQFNITVLSNLDGEIVAQNQYKYIKEIDAINNALGIFD